MRMNYERLHDALIAKAMSRTLTGYKERHHIIPRCMGGGDESENLVDLTAKEHFIVHKLLVEIYPEVKGLKYALWMMANKVGNGIHEREYRIGSREYQRLREQLVHTIKSRPPMSLAERERRRERMSGSNNPMYGISLAGPANGMYGKRHSVKSKRKISDSKVGTQTGENNPFYGKAHSEATKKRWSEMRSGKRWMNNGITESLFKSDIYQSKLDDGWEFGRLKKQIYNKLTQKKVLHDIKTDNNGS